MESAPVFQNVRAFTRSFVYFSLGLMPLSYGKSSPKDMLAKAQRDLIRLESAEAEQDSDAMSDALFDLAVVLTSLKDWLKKHPSAAFSETTVEQYSASSMAENAM